MRRHWSLVLFTLLVQSAVGSVWWLQAALFLNGDGSGLPYLNIHIMVALGLVVAGLVAAMTHLGKPGESRHAVRNFKTSWLSREIFTVNLFAGILAAMVLFSLFHPAILNHWTLLMAGLFGGAVLNAMTQVYCLKTVPTWNHPGTPLNFLGSALLLGGLQSTLVLTMLKIFGHDAMGSGKFLNTALLVAVVGFLVKLSAAGVTPSRAGAEGSFITLQPVLQGCGMVFWAASILFIGSPLMQSVPLLLAAASLIYGEIIHRDRFYDSYQRVGL